MKFLFDDKHAPITQAIGFIKFPAKDVVKEYVDWMTPIQAGRINYISGEAAPVSLNVRHGSSGLLETLNTLLPLTGVEARRILFIQTASDWTAYFDNGWRGPDVFPPVSELCQRLRCNGVRATCVPNTISKKEGHYKGRYGATVFELYGPYPNPILNTVRSVFASFDTKWEFNASGTEQPYEEVEAYSAKKVRDRFTPDMLDRYLQAIGIRAFDPAFYESPGGHFLVEKVGPFAPGLKEYSLDEARAHY